MNEKIEKILKSWYEYAKASAPDHYEGGHVQEYGECRLTTLPYTFETFKTSPLVQAAIIALTEVL